MARSPAHGAPPPQRISSASRERTPRRGAWARLESWLWTGPLGHLAGGFVDFATALTRYWMARALRAPRTRSRARTGPETLG